MYCKFCGDDIPGNVATCPSCGRSVQSKEVKNQFKEKEKKEKDAYRYESSGLFRLKFKHIVIGSLAALVLLGIRFLPTMMLTSSVVEASEGITVSYTAEIKKDLSSKSMEILLEMGFDPPFAILLGDGDSIKVSDGPIDLEVYQTEEGLESIMYGDTEIYNKSEGIIKYKTDLE